MADIGAITTMIYYNPFISNQLGRVLQEGIPLLTLNFILWGFALIFMILAFIEARKYDSKMVAND